MRGFSFHFFRCSKRDFRFTPFFFVLYCSTFVCPTEIIAFSDRVEEFKKINTEVIAVSVDSVFTHLAW